MHLSTKQKQTCGFQEGGGGRGIDWEFGVGRCKLLHLEWLNNKVLMYSTANYIQNYIQYPETNHNGKQHKKMYICV